MFEFDETMYGRKVKFIDQEQHEEWPRYFPEVGTIGTIVRNEDNLDIFDDNIGPGNDPPWKVQWPEGSVAGDGCWLVDAECIELVGEDKE